MKGTPVSADEESEPINFGEFAATTLPSLFNSDSVRLTVSASSRFKLPPVLFFRYTLPDINVEILAAVAELVDEATEDVATELGADDKTVEVDDALDKDDDIVDETTEETLEDEIADDNVDEETSDEEDLTDDADVAGAELAGGVSLESDPPPQAESAATKPHAINKLSVCFIR